MKKGLSSPASGASAFSIPKKGRSLSEDGDSLAGAPIMGGGTIPKKAKTASGFFGSGSEGGSSSGGAPGMMAIPKKTRLYLEQTEREKELAPWMHRQFQKDIVKLQVTTAKAYLKLLQRGQIAAGKTGGDGDAVHLGATVRGLGPYFHLVVELRAMGTQALLQVPVLVTYNHALYRMSRALATVPRRPAPLSPFFFSSR